MDAHTDRRLRRTPDRRDFLIISLVSEYLDQAHRIDLIHKVQIDITGSGPVLDPMVAQTAYPVWGDLFSFLTFAFEGLEDWDSILV